MHEACTAGMHAFTIGTHDSSTDESQEAIRYAREMGIDQTVEYISTGDAVNLLDDVVSSCGEPFGDFSIFPSLLVSRMARKRFTVMLSGDGGDELFWGYARHFGPLINGVGDFCHTRRWRQMMRIVRRLSPWLRTDQSSRYNSFGEWHRAGHSRLPENCLRQVFPRMPEWPDEYGYYHYTGCDSDDAAQWLRQSEFASHLSGILLKVDRASMYSSLEVRVPLLDREVIDVAVQVDWKDCFDPVRRTGKIPLRRILARYVSFQTSAKKGFEPPMGEWLRDSLRPVVEDVLMTRDSLAGVEVDKKALRDLYKSHLEERDYGWGLWPLVGLALWERHYGR
jgi:asparagine synthase (glutamine-hydrolysing)